MILDAVIAMLAAAGLVWLGGLLFFAWMHPFGKRSQNACLVVNVSGCVDVEDLKMIHWLRCFFPGRLRAAITVGAADTAHIRDVENVLFDEHLIVVKDPADITKLIMKAPE